MPIIGKITQPGKKEKKVKYTLETNRNVDI